MNKTLSSIIVVLILMLASISCKKTDSEPSNNSTPTSNSTAAISYNDGTSVSVDSAQAVLYTAGGGVIQREIDIYAFKGGKQVLEFHFQPKTGSQPVAQNFASAWLTYLTNNMANYPEDYYNCKSGNFNLTTCDTVANKIIGTFDFIGNNGTIDKSITAGKINISKIKKN